MKTVWYEIEINIYFPFLLDTNIKQWFSISENENEKKLKGKGGKKIPYVEKDSFNLCLLNISEPIQSVSRQFSSIVITSESQHHITSHPYYVTNIKPDVHDASVSLSSPGSCWNRWRCSRSRSEWNFQSRNTYVRPYRCTILIYFQFVEKFHFISLKINLSIHKQLKGCFFVAPPKLFLWSSNRMESIYSLWGIKSIMN